MVEGHKHELGRSLVGIDLRPPGFGFLAMGMWNVLAGFTKETHRAIS